MYCNGKKNEYFENKLIIYSVCDACMQLSAIEYFPFLTVIIQNMEAPTILRAFY